MKIVSRAIAESIVLVLLIAFFLPLVRRTDVPPPGAPPEPWYVPVVGIVAVYVVPLIIVLANGWRQLRR